MTCWLLAVLGSLRWHKIIYLAPEHHKNFSNASVVSFGCSSRIQCPAFFRTMTVTSVATNFICCPSTSPSDFSPPMDNTGIVNFVCDSCTKSLAVCGNELKYAQPAFMRPGRAYAAESAARSASGNEWFL